jgi:hypothetical protein
MRTPIVAGLAILTLACAAHAQSTRRGYAIIPYRTCFPAPIIYDPCARPYGSYAARRYGYTSYSVPYGYSPYPHHPYTYAPRFYCAPTVHTVYGSPIYNSNPPVSYDSLMSESSADREEQDGWPLLGEGDSQKAIKAFTNAARTAGDDADPKVGYAICAADLGDDTTAIWAMRRAFRLDAYGAHYLALSDDVRKLVGDLRRQYEYESQIDGEDAWFMVAALHYIAHEDVKAEYAAERATQSGDRSYELRQLKRQLERAREIPVESADADDEATTDSTTENSIAEDAEDDAG